MPLPPPPPDHPEGKLPTKIKKKGGFPPELLNAEVVDTEYGDKKQKARIDANWKTIADVDWEDLEHFINCTRSSKDNADFDTCIRILEALRKQISTK